MIGPDKVALIFLKVFVILLAVTLLSSVANLVPYYMSLSRVADDLLMRAAINNYILASQVESTVRDGIINNDYINAVTYKGVREYGPAGPPVSGCLKVDGKDSGVFIYIFIGEKPKSSANVGEYNVAYANMASKRKVILNEGSGFDPKTKPGDAVKFDSTYHGAQRGETITVVAEAKVKGRVWFIGLNREFEIPISVVKSGPAMYYYRNLGV